MQPPCAPEIEAPLDCDISLRFVRVLQRRSNGLVEFEFSIGWPELSVELMLPERAFADFCVAQKARLLPG